MSETRYATTEPGSDLHETFEACLEGGFKWSAAMVAVAALLEIAPFEQYVVSLKKLYLAPKVFFDNEDKLDAFFRLDPDVGYRTPMMNRKRGKEIHQGYLDIVAKHQLGHVPELSNILQDLRMVNRSFHSGYKNVILVEVEDQYFLRWDGDEAPTPKLEHVTDAELIRQIDEEIYVSYKKPE